MNACKINSLVYSSIDTLALKGQSEIQPWTTFLYLGKEASTPKFTSESRAHEIPH